MAFLNVNMASEALRRKVSFYAYIPNDNMNFAGYVGEVPSEFRTLYLLHGYAGDASDWPTHINVRNWATKHNCAVIMPSADNWMWLDIPYGINNYGVFVGDELVRKTREMFRLSSKREDTFIAGLSMGGFGAVRNGLKYHDTFSLIGSFSGAHNQFDDVQEDMGPLTVDADAFIDWSKYKDTDKNPKYLVEKLAQEGKTDQKIFISCGKKDPLFNTNVKMRDLLIEKGFDTTWGSEPELGHEWAYWAIALDEFGEFLDKNSR